MSLTSRSYSLMPRARARSMQARQALRSPMRSGSKYCWDRALVTDLDMAGFSDFTASPRHDSNFGGCLILTIGGVPAVRFTRCRVNLGNFYKRSIGELVKYSLPILTSYGGGTI